MGAAADNYFDLEPLIIKRLRDKVSGIREVLSQADLVGVEVEAQITPALHVLFYGFKPEPHSDGHRLYLTEQWYVVIAVRNPRGGRGAKAARQDVGQILQQVMRALELWKPCKAYGLFRLASGDRPTHLPGGYAFAPLLYEVQHGFPLDTDELGAAADNETILPTDFAPTSVGINGAALVGEPEDCEC